MESSRSDDPLNRTAADNAEWLLRFKRAMGILPASDDADVAGDAWMSGLAVEPGTNQLAETSAGLFGSGPTTTVYTSASAPQTSAIDSMMDFVASSEAIVDRPFLDSGTVFTNKDFEEKLVQFSVAEVASSGRMPPDESIKAKAKEISGLEVWQAETTPADDPMLLVRFKQLVVDKVKAVLGAHDERPANSFPQYQHSQPHRSPGSIQSPSVPIPDRGMDAIDPGLLPALDTSNLNATETQIKPSTPLVHVAISEKRLEEIIGEMGRGGR